MDTDHSEGRDQAKPEEISRRRFLSQISIALSALAGAIVSIPMIAYVLSPLLERSGPTWRTLGPADEFPIGDYRLVSYQDPSPVPWAGTTARTAVYVWREPDNSFRVFSVHCAHLGCPVNWVSTAQLFLCPCHGGAYYVDGERAAGPPPRGLYPYQYRLRFGQLEILSQPLPTPHQPPPRTPQEDIGP